MRKHHLTSLHQNVHWGYLDSSIPPVLKVKSGDTVVIDTISGSPQLLRSLEDGFDVLPDFLDVFEHHDRGLGPHIMTGPVYVEGAAPGDTLEVSVIDIQLRQNWGYNIIRPLAGALPEDFIETTRLIKIPLDMNNMTARLPWGVDVPLAPFFGLMATAPRPAYGAVTSAIPREFGGNFDNKEIRPGTKLLLPVFNEGALFSIGDGHAAQGDGEVCTTALETSLRGTFQFRVRKDISLDTPRIETRTHLITMGFDQILDLAAKYALRDMLQALREVAGLSAEDAYTLVSLAGDMRVTQLVNVNKGIHLMIPKAVAYPEDNSQIPDSGADIECMLAADR